MMANWRHFIDGDRVYLREVVNADVTARYVAWLNDAEVGRYLETRFTTHTETDVRAYVAAQAAAADAVFLAIVRKSDDCHVGNVRIGAIDRRHGSATIALIIGDRSAWGAGIGTEAIALTTKYAFDTLGLRKLTARCYGVNLGSIRAFEKAGWSREGVQRGQFVSDGKRVDAVWLGIVDGRA